MALQSLSVLQEHGKLADNVVKAEGGLNSLKDRITFLDHAVEGLSESQHDITNALRGLCPLLQDLMKEVDSVLLKLRDAGEEREMDHCPQCLDESANP
jgi:predicted  nucleic acid-binding Zn-ribbon protein